MLSIAKLSSKGQVIIPGEIRHELGLKTGVQFLIYAEKDAIVFKIVQVPLKEDFEKVLAKAQRAAKKTGFKKEVIAEEISKFRRQRKQK
jgi:AbrB family looped-hinge helix DNA binding protein